MNVNFCYRSLNKVESLIKVHKDRLPSNSNKNVVYKIQCRDCDATYVGQTDRLLTTRINEHKNYINRKTSCQSVITQHRLEHSHEF